MHFPDSFEDLNSVSEFSNLISDDTENSSSNNVGAQRRIGLYTACSFVLGAIVGSGIYVTPLFVLRNCGSIGGALTIWGCSGLIATIGALCYIEFGTTFPESGCDYVYLRKSIGDLPAFLYLWVQMVITIPASRVITSLTFANYVLEPFFPHCAVPQNGLRLVAAIIICKYNRNFSLTICNQSYNFCTGKLFSIF